MSEVIATTDSPVVTVSASLSSPPTKTSDLTNDSNFQNDVQVLQTIEDNKQTVPTKVSDLENDSNFQNETEVATSIEESFENTVKAHTELIGLNDDADNTHISQELKNLLESYGIQTLRPQVFNIKCNAGRFNCSWGNTDGIMWQFPDDTVLYSDGVTPIKASYDSQPDVIIANDNSTVKLSCVNWVGTYAFLDNDIDGNLLINLADLPALSYYLDLSNCPLVTGNLADLPALSYCLRLSNCSLVTGAYTQISGETVPATTDLSYTNVSSTDMDSTLIAYASCTKSNGSFSANGMTRTSASDDAVATLVARGWTISGLTTV